MKILQILQNTVVQKILIEVCRTLLELLQNGKLPKDKSDFLIKQIKELS